MTTGVLVYILMAAHVLLVKRPAGLGVWKWNAPGGLVEFGESAVKAALRTTKASAGVNPVIEQPLGEVLYHHPVHGNWRVTIFRTEEFTGEPTATAESTPQWHPIDDLPYPEMWAGDDIWVPYVISNTPFMVELWFDEADKIVNKDMQLRSL